MRRPIAFLLAVILLAGTSCSYHRAHLWYREYDDSMPMKADSWDGEALGTVSTREGGFLWTSCTKAARGALWHLIDETQRLGGNAIGDFRWIQDDENDPEKVKRNFDVPTCQKKWGWFALWPFLLTPQFLSARVEAQAYRVDSLPASSTSFYRIPASDTERQLLVERILLDLAVSASLPPEERASHSNN